MQIYDLVVDFSSWDRYNNIIWNYIEMLETYKSTYRVLEFSRICKMR